MSSFDNQSYDPSILDIDGDAYSTSGNGKNNRTPSRPEPEVPRPGKNTKEEEPASDTAQSKPKKEKKTKTEPEGPSVWSKIANFLSDRRTHGAVGLILIGFAAYVLIASLSFIFSGSKDMSAVSGHSIEQLAQEPGSVENLGGPAGAVMSQVILTNSFGIGALVMVFYIITIGLALLRVTTIKFWSFTFKSLLIALTLSMVAGLATYGIESEFLWGGQHGRMLNTLLIQRFGLTGAIIVSAVLMGLIAMIYLNQLISLYKKYNAKMAERRAEREKERLEKEKLARENNPDLERKNEVVSVENAAAHHSNEDVIFGMGESVAGEDAFGDVPAMSNPAASAVTPAADTLLGDISALKKEIPEYTTEPQAQPEISAAAEPVIIPASQPSVTAAAQTVHHNPEPAEELLLPVAEKHEVKPVQKPSNGVEIPVEVIHNQIEQAENIDQPFDPTAELSHYHFPPLELLIDHPNTSSANTVQEDDKERIIRSLREYGIKINKIDATVGPTVTLFEIVPEEGTRIQQIKRLEDDLMRSLSAVGIRIVAPIPGKGTIGIEVPNKNPQTVGIRAVLSSKKYQEFKGELPMAMGATISNEVYVADLAKMPHLLVAGATGQGKSVGLNTIIASLIYKKHPSTLKFVLIDPKMVEFSLYSKLEHHYLAKMADEEEPIITASDRVLSTLNSLCVEMDNRYMLLKSAGVRNIKEYNEKFVARQLNPEKGHNFLPYIVVIIDEFADLITVLGKEVETPVARITAKARAVGIHMIIATQRPSIDVITGVIKNNIPGRIAFKVPQSTDSKTILDRTGANQLIGRGDMLFLNGSNLERVQCAFIDTPEVEAICNFIENEQGYPTPYILPDYNPNGGNEGNAGAVTDRDPLFGECARFIVQSGTASTSSLQRRYGIGYNRAGKIMDQMEAAGIVGPAMGSKPRQVLMDIMAVENLLETMGV